ncbi:hypothetical protein MKW98_010854 [Papaver atlanticum]|uniref:Uncharacterized protein n=1 Tax=Papaver atlanticum TaxID=357466 RepID=A0AAD4SPV4_9MAGN|nr:hypothetical protein MKW98_010854 [Papaver atlanticum]
MIYVPQARRLELRDVEMAYRRAGVARRLELRESRRWCPTEAPGIPLRIVVAICSLMKLMPERQLFSKLLLVLWFTLAVPLVILNDPFLGKRAEEGNFSSIPLRDEFVENACRFIFEAYCIIHQRIDIGTLTAKLNMSFEAA